MHFIDVFINNPVKVTACVILLVLFGLLTVTPPSIAPSPIRVPVQLTPDLDEPIVSVSTFWEGASPEEVEREIIEPQEEVLKGVTNLRKMTSSSASSSASVEMEFNLGTSLDVAKQDVSDALRRVKYQIPINEFDNPIVQSGRPFGEEAIAWMIMTSDDANVHVPNLLIFVEDNVKPILERVAGVSSVRVFGGREREIQVVVDPLKLSQAGITFQELQFALVSQNTNVSAGNSAQGKRDILIRTMGQFAGLEDVRQTVIRTGPGGPIRVADVAEVVDGFKKRYSFVRSEGKEVLALAGFREAGSNVMQVMEGLRAAIEQVNNEVLAPRGMKLELTKVYDETSYISAAIDLVLNNIIWATILTVAVLVIFLRSFSGTVIIAVAIPISIIGTFLIVPLAGRNMNVVMLAGLAFAVGMVVDNAIVVLENIFRHREMGKSRMKAASDGASEVWGAVLANSLTTMIVFLPIIFVKEEAGQLFRDIAIAISGAVGLSLLVSIAVIPPLASRILAKSARTPEEGAGRFAHAVANLVGFINRRFLTRAAVVVGFTVASILFSIWLAPQPSYLPSGNQNLIFGILVTPPGYNTAEFERIALLLENGDPAKGTAGIRPFWEVKKGTPEYEQLLARWSQMVEGMIVPGLEGQIKELRASADKPETTRKERKPIYGRIRELRRQIAEWREPPPPIENFFLVAWGGGCFMGASSDDPDNIKPLEKVLNSTGFGLPDSFAIFFQLSIFGNLGSGNSVDVEIRADDMNQVVTAGRNLMMACAERFGGRPEANPQNFAIDRREDRLIPDRVRAGDLGLNVADIGSIVRACGDGRVVGQYREAGRSFDLTIKVAGTEEPQTGRSATAMIADVPIYAPTGQIVPLSAVCRTEQTTAPQQINHIETQRSVKLTIRPPEGVSLPEVIDIIQQDIVGAMRAEGYGASKAKIAPEVIVSLAGNADKLQSTWDSMKWLLGLSFLIVYLLMAGLFESFSYPFVIIFTVPLAVVGGFVGLALMNYWTWSNPRMAIQQLDMLTILGFVILLGTVVNNGILIVHQSLNFISYGMAPEDAICESVRTRIRPIFMTVLTTVFGMLPLVIKPGAGAELYRGLGAVVLSGLMCSTIFTLVVVPAMLSLFIGARVHLSRWLFGHQPRTRGVGQLHAGADAGVVGSETPAAAPVAAVVPAAVSAPIGVTATAAAPLGQPK